MPARPSRRGALLWLTLINLALLVLLVAVESVIAERHWLTTLITYAPQQLFCIPTAVLLLVAVLKRRWRVASWNAVAGVICLFFLLGFAIPHFRHSAGVPVRVMTFNIKHLAGGIRGVSAVVAREHPDVLCLQEINADRGTAAPMPQLQAALPGWYYARTRETAIFSRHPLLAHSTFPVKGTGREMLKAEVAIQGKRLGILCVHLSTSATGSSLQDSRGSRRAHLRKTAKIRLQQARMIQDIAGQSSVPLIVAGDFNTPPRGIIYLRLRVRFTDAFAQAGWGTGYTYPARPPVLRIDYLWTDRSIGIQRCYRPASTASDHYPMVADLRL